MQTTTLFSLVLVLISHVMAWWSEDKGAEAATVEPPAEVAEAEPAPPEEQKATASIPVASGCPETEDAPTEPQAM